MIPEYIEKRVRDIAPQLRDQLLSAHHATAHPDHLSADQSSNVIRKLDGSILAKDRAAIFVDLGIAADGLSWPRLDEQVQLVLDDELRDLFAYVRHDAYRDLAENGDDFAIDKTDYQSALDTMRRTIVSESLAGTLAAIDLIRNTAARHQFNAAQLLATLGMTVKQVQVYFAAVIKARKVHAEIQKSTGDVEKQAAALHAELKGVPARISDLIRRIIREGRSLTQFSMEDTRKFSKAISSQQRRYRADALAKLAVVTVVNVTELSVWKQAQRMGVVGSDALKFWQTAGDERVRHVHEETAAMNSGGVALGDPFKTPLGVSVQAPPLEVNCRCSVVLGSPASKRFTAPSTHFSEASP